MLDPFIVSAALGSLVGVIRALTEPSGAVAGAIVVAMAAKAVTQL